MTDNISCYDVLIVGAGPAGLTAAYALTKNSPAKVMMIESNPAYVGGISRTENYKDYLFDIGGHRFFSKSDKIEQLWQEILPKDLMERSRLSRIYYRGKLFHYPLKAFEVVKNLGIIESCLCILSYMKTRLRPIKPVSSFRDWVTNMFGERLFSIFFKSYTEKVWGIACEDISADWAAQRIRGLNLMQLIMSTLLRPLKTVFGQRRKNKIIKTLIEKFRYPRRGPGMLWTAMADKIRGQGGILEMGVKATGFEWREDEKAWEVTTVTLSGREKKYTARQIISSAPLRETIPAITPQPDCGSLLSGLRYRDFILVALVLNKPAGFQDNWIYIHDPFVKVGRIQNFQAWSPFMIPEGGQGCLGMEYFCQEDDEFWRQSDEVLIGLAKRELESLELMARDSVVDGRVVRQSKAYPCYDGDYQTILETMKKEMAKKHPTFHMIGRNGMHRYNNQDHAMMTALLTVDNIVAGKQIYDVWAVNEDAEYHEAETS